MKLGFSTLGCPEWTLEQILKYGRDFGFQGVEIRGIAGRMNADEIPEFLPENQKETLGHFAAYGLEISDFASSVQFHDLSKRQAMEKEWKDCIRLCAAAGIPAIRVFGNEVAQADTVEEEVKIIAEGIQAMCDDAKGLPVSIWLEVHGTVNTAPRIEKIAEKVNSPQFGIIWDVAHSDDPYRDDFLSFYHPIRSLIRHVHLKDHRRLPDGGKQLCQVGEGDLPLIAIIEQLEKDGYQGYYSLEWEKKWHPNLADASEAFPAYVEWMRKHFG